MYDKTTDWASYSRPRKDGLNPESLTALIPQPLAHSSRRRREQPYKIVKLPSCDVSIRITYTDVSGINHLNDMIQPPARLGAS